MARAAENVSPANDFPFDRERFRRHFRDLAPRIAAEWPEVGVAALDSTAGDAGSVVDLVAERTQHSKTLVRKQLAEIVEAAEPSPSPIEARLLRVLHALEASVEPIESEAQRVATKAARAFEDVEAEGRAVVRDLKSRATSTEENLKKSFWTTLLVTLGLGVIAGLFLGRGHGRR